MMYTAYHGTDKESFEHFNCPAYFAGSIVIAEFFAKRAAENSYIFQCQLDFKNPLIVDLDDQPWNSFFLKNEKLQEKITEYAANGDLEELDYFRAYGLTTGFLVEYAEHAGYDGLIMYNCRDEEGRSGTQYVAFKTEEIFIQNVISSQA